MDSSESKLSYHFITDSKGVDFQLPFFINKFLLKSINDYILNSYYNTMRWLLPLFLLILFELIADIFAKTWSLRSGWWYAAGALVSYLICNSFWLIALKNGSGLARGAAIFSVISAILAIVLGVLFYKESITRLQIIGMALGVISVALLFWE
jgi:drug/metabolite transporter (DMT)-like permease